MPSIVPLIEISLDRTRHLRFDRRAVFTAERELTRCWGTPWSFYGAMVGLMDAISQGDIARLSVNTIAILVWQGLLHEAPTLTLEETQDLLPYMDPVGMVQVCGALLQAWNAATQPPPGSPLPGEGDAASPLPRSTGSPSGVPSAVNSGLVTTSFGA